jgi:hypothetical protein
MVLETKSSLEAGVVGAGHSFGGSRLDAQRSVAGWASEAMGGVSYLDFIRGLVARVDSDWEGVQADLEAIRRAAIRLAPASGFVQTTAYGFVRRGAALLLPRHQGGRLPFVMLWRAEGLSRSPDHPPLAAPCRKALLQRRGVLVNMTADDKTLQLAAGAQLGGAPAWPPAAPTPAEGGGHATCSPLHVALAVLRLINLSSPLRSWPPPPLLPSTSGHVASFLDALPAASADAASWQAPLQRQNEALVVPTQVCGVAVEGA